MGFKSVKSYNEEKFGGLFLLRNDGDFADVIFLYQSADDVLVADTHYIKSAEYNGYVHCCGAGCPACAKGIRTQTKLFIPLYNIMENEIQYFDRTMRFEPQLQKDVFSGYPNPSEFVFRIIRHGEAGDVNTTYEIKAVGLNSFKSFAQIMAENNTSMPEHYENVCKDVSTAELQKMLSDKEHPTTNYSPSDYASQYSAVPRGGSSVSGVVSGSPEVPEVPDIPDIPMPEYTADSAEKASEDLLAASDESDEPNESLEELGEDPEF